MKSRTCIALTLVLLCALAGAARAEMISYSFQGSNFLIGGSPQPLSGSITFDTHGTLISTNGLQSTFSTYGSITLATNSSTVSTLSFGPNLLVMLAPDHMDVRYQSWGTGPLPKSPPWLFIQLAIDGTGPTPIFPDISSLPSRLPPGVSGPLILDGHFTERDVVVQGQLRNFASVSVASLPEPGSLVLAVSGGLFGLARSARRRRRAQ